MYLWYRGTLVLTMPMPTPEIILPATTMANAPSPDAPACRAVPKEVTTMPARAAKRRPRLSLAALEMKM